jgi:DNA mismatch repair protein MutS2
MISVEVVGKSLRLAMSAVEVLDAPVTQGPPRVVITHELSASSRDFSPELHVRGMRVEEALEKVDKYLDDAAVLGVMNLRIVHGKGEGALSGAITTLLDESFLVASYGWAPPEEGGWGVTMVEMAQRRNSDGGAS